MDWTDQLSLRVVSDSRRPILVSIFITNSSMRRDDFDSLQNQDPVSSGASKTDVSTYRNFLV